MRGLLGKKLSHSYSKIIHESIDKSKYDLIELDELDSFFQEKAFEALNVTIPYKNDVIAHLDSTSETVQVTKSCNTIVNKDGKLYGHNTDYSGFEFMCKENDILFKDKVVGIIGNGSTSRTIAFYSDNEKAKQTLVFARNPKANEINIANIDQYPDIEILINATPVGMYPDNKATLGLHLSKYPNLKTVIDLIYNPLKTKLLIDAEKLNIKTVNGLLMLVSQAVKANELFNNTTYPESLTLSIYSTLKFEMLNIVFIGMPMSGKTFYAKQISSKYNKVVVDLDNKLEEDTGKSIPEIFNSDGEQAFRSIEKRIAYNYSKGLSQAISTGGGIILNPENIDNLKQNGIIIFLDMSLQDLMACNPKNRPLLQNPDDLERLYNERKPLYNKYCDIIIPKKGYDQRRILSVIEVKLNEYLNTKWS